MNGRTHDMRVEVPSNRLIQGLRDRPAHGRDELWTRVGPDTGLENATGYSAMIAVDTNTEHDVTHLIVHHLLALIVALEQTEEFDHI